MNKIVRLKDLEAMRDRLKSRLSYVCIDDNSNVERDRVALSDLENQIETLQATIGQGANDATGI